MELTSPAIIKDLLGTYDAKPQKGLGQNFLIDKNILQKTITSANLTKKDLVVEIGPGIGVLTKELAQVAGRVISIEKDKTMLAILEKTLAEHSNIEVVSEDALEVNMQKLTKGEPYSVVANIPYYITSPLIRKFLEEKHPPKDIILMIQKEVAQRICAKPPNMSILAVSVQFYAAPKIISYVSKGCFWPVPNVDSAIIQITPKKNPYTINPDLFFTIVKAGFSHPRKQLLNNLSTTLKLPREKVEAWLTENNLLPNQRAETLTVEHWVNLAKTF